MRVLLCWLLLAVPLLAQTEVGSMPDLKGHPQSQALQQLQSLRLEHEVRWLKVVHPNLPRGRVVGTTPVGGAELFSTSKVVVRVSAGPGRSANIRQEVSAAQTEGGHGTEMATLVVFVCLQLLAGGLLLVGIRLRVRSRSPGQ